MSVWPFTPFPACFHRTITEIALGLYLKRSLIIWHFVLWTVLFCQQAEAWFIKTLFFTLVFVAAPGKEKWWNIIHKYLLNERKTHNGAAELTAIQKEETFCNVSIRGFISAHVRISDKTQIVSRSGRWFAAAGSLSHTKHTWWIKVCQKWNTDIKSVRCFQPVADVNSRSAVLPQGADYCTLKLNNYPPWPTPWSSQCVFSDPLERSTDLLHVPGIN